MPWSLSAIHAVQDIAAGLRVDAHGGLVHVDHLRFVQQRHADVDAPLHAAGILSHQLLRPVGQSDGLQHFGDSLCRALPRSRTSSPRSQVLTGGEILVQGDLLRHNAQHRLDPHRVLATECPITRASPWSGRSKVASIEMVVVFPAPFGPSRLISHPERFVEADPLHGFDLPKGFVQVLDFDCAQNNASIYTTE